LNRNEVTLLDGAKEVVGTAEVVKVISAKPEGIDLEDLKKCGFETAKKALEYVKAEHGEEFNRDGVFTIYFYRVVSRK